MLFSSIVFLFYFLPIFFALYYLARGGNLVLLLGSVLFYAWGELRYLWLLALVTLVTWSGGNAIHLAQRHGQAGRLALAAAVSVDLVLLGWFKYAGFIADQLAALRIGPTAPLGHQWALPLGISFFTFHSISYLMDIYRRAVSRPARVIDLCVYMTMFPQLVAGPIVRYAGIAAQIERRRATLPGIASGIQLFILGLAQKVLLANTLGVPVDRIFARAPETLDAGTAWLGAVGYMLQLYFDFGGYSLMAIGLGRMMGLTFPPNFDNPYISRSVTEFWRRWHISLSTWFRDYVYIPLGGSRRGRARTYLNLWSVFLLCGLWHGAAWTFVLWGIYHGTLLMIERAGLGAVLERAWAPLRHAYALLAVLLGWVLFRADTPTHAWRFAEAMFAGGPSPTAMDAPYLTPSIVTAYLVAAVASLPWARLGRALDQRARPAWLAAGGLASVVVSAGLLLLSAASLAAGTYNPFIYFRF